MLFNRRRAERIMAREGIDALVATSPDNVMYATDYECTTHWANKGFQIYSVFTPGHDPNASLIVPGLELEALVDGDVWVDDFYVFSPFPRGPAGDVPMDHVGQAVDSILERAHSTPRAIDGLIAAIEARGLEKGRIAVDEVGISMEAFQELETRFPGADLVPAGAIWWQIRMVKTAEEVNRLREASRITEEAIHEAFQLVRPGAKEGDISRAYHRGIVERDARPTFMLLGSGSRSGYPHPLGSEKIIEAGDVVRYDVGCTYRYYHADTARAVVLGTPSDEQRRIWDALRTGVAEAVAVVRPGADVADLFRVAMKPARDAGLAGFDRFHCGHGIGISIYDPPVVTDADPSASAFLMPSTEKGLEPGMVLNIEVGYYVQGVQGFLCEDTMLVTESGREMFTTCSTALAYDDYMAEARV